MDYWDVSALYRAGPTWDGRESELVNTAYPLVGTDGNPTIAEALDAVGASSDEKASILGKLAAW